MGVLNLMAILREHAPSSISQVTPTQLAGKHIAIDASVSMYQFLASSQQDTLAMVRGLFLRTINLIENGITPVYVFDGKPPDIKTETLARRELRRKKAADQIAASANGPDHEEEAIRLARQTMKVTAEHVKACKELFDLMGVAYVQAPEEAEAQCVELVKSGRCYAVGSEDSDVLPFGGAILLKSLTFCSGKTHATQVRLREVLTTLNLGRSELVKMMKGDITVESTQGEGLFQSPSSEEGWRTETAGFRSSKGCPYLPSYPKTRHETRASQ